MSSERSEVEADLQLTVHSAEHDFTAHLHSDGDELTLDVDQPGALVTELRALPRADLPRELAHAAAGLSVIVRSGETKLGRVALTGAGRLRIRPTRHGVLLVIRDLLSRSRVKVGLTVLVPIVLAVVSRPWWWRVRGPIRQRS